VDREVPRWLALCAGGEPVLKALVSFVHWDVSLIEKARVATP
jgi:hypothetical protein